MTTKKLLNSAGRQQVGLQPAPYGPKPLKELLPNAAGGVGRKFAKDPAYQFEHPKKFCNSMHGVAPQNYPWLHLRPNTRTGT
ncbi:hypothetical protein RD110_10885 [Rhodoferax koreense]|uniref:Uncharacterized protein n=1 Tax=Rhodoferax koreensis TaxID=1842727 RepID=A0A1P8JV63_9BURK|nr:hypothetical protein [Rhodoferax koreense]APW37632.1 hypothetical protein RD110_10885 [Rhodoferax koreense]